MDPLRFVIADVFTDEPLTGNQLAVFPDGAAVPGERLQALAKEIGFSETVFCFPGDDGTDARIRIFTPAQELPFAGHPVLGTAVVLGRGAAAEVLLETGAGTVPVRIDAIDARRAFAWMTQPVPTVERVDDPAPILSALGVAGSDLPVDRYDNGVPHLYVTLGDEVAVATVEPDFGALRRALPDAGVSCIAGAGTRWTSRMFAPGLGVNEDPATGSAAGPLAVHLARHGRVEFGTEIVISQGAAIGRPSTLRARADGTANAVERVDVGGSVVVVGRGEFELPEAAA